MKRCPECGQYSEDSASFCPRCGRMLPDIPDAPGYGPNMQMPPARRKSPSIGLVVGVVAVSAILLAAAIGIMDIIGNSSQKYSDKTLTYSWTVPSIGSSPTFSVTVELPGDEMSEADRSTIGRGGSTTDLSDHASGVYAVREYVVVSDTIKALSASLWAEFKTKVVDTGSPYANAKYFADYVLAFIQEAADYRYDSDAFGEDEYWQYPIETLYRGYGDCEDTSILGAAVCSQLSVMEGAGDWILGASVLLLPGHAMVGMQVNGLNQTGLFKVSVGTAFHHTGETTIDDPSKYPSGIWHGVGFLDPDYYGASIQAFTGTSSVYV